MLTTYSSLLQPFCIRFMPLFSCLVSIWNEPHCFSYSMLFSYNSLISPICFWCQLPALLLNWTLGGCSSLCFTKHPVGSLPHSNFINLAQIDWINGLTLLTTKWSERWLEHRDSLSLISHKLIIYLLQIAQLLGSSFSTRPHPLLITLSCHFLFPGDSFTYLRH